jgi:hypothetical protein
MGWKKSSLVMNCFLMVSALLCPAGAQTASEMAPAGTAAAMALSGQEFHCHTGYSLAQCQRDILQLKSVLSRYPIGALGHWTWILVRSQDWKPISQRLRLNPESPAFTALEQRETFLEEALFLHDPLRTAELMKEWQLSMSKLLELAVTHELGHAFCAEPSEAAADRFGEELRNGLRPPCQVSKRSKRRVESGELHGLKPNALSSASVRP